MIELIQPGRNAIIGGELVRSSYSTISAWNHDYIYNVIAWLTSGEYDAGNLPGSSIFVYPIVIAGRTDSIRFTLDVENQAGALYPGGFHPLDEFGVPLTDDMFSIQVDVPLDNRVYTFFQVLPLAVSWIDPLTSLRTFAHGVRRIVARTQPDIKGKYDEHRLPFTIDIRPPSQPIIDQQNQIVTTRDFNITGTVANLDGGSWIIHIK